MNSRTNNSSMSDWNTVTNWNDISWNNHDATQWWVWKSPIFKTGWINSLPYVEFDWSNDILKISSAADINNDWDCYANKTFKEKSFAIVLKTGQDVTSTQVIYEQWWNATWYNFAIKDWEIWAWIHNKSDSSYSCTDYSDTDSNYYYQRDSWNKFKSVKLDEAIPNTVYYIMIVQDSTHIDWNWNLIDSMNKLQIFLNGKLVMESNHVDPQPEHHLIWLWAVNEATVYPWNNNTETCNECDYFKWWIWEFISWNHALTKNEVRWIQNYFIDKWLGWKQNIEYNIIDTSIKEYNF